MPFIEVEGKKIELDSEGFLVKFEDWNEKVACALADRENVSNVCPLTKERIEIFQFMREFYKKFNAFPLARAICTNVHTKECNLEKFPDGSVAWKIAGLPRPPEYLLSVFQACGS
jgi:tRNA 2-thiouridine synthesizing protein E